MIPDLLSDLLVFTCIIPVPRQIEPDTKGYLIAFDRGFIKFVIINRIMITEI